MLPWDIPLEHTSAANFFDLFMKLHEEAHSESYDFRLLLSLLSSVHLEELLKAHEINIHPLVTKIHKKIIGIRREIVGIHKAIIGIHRKSMVH